MIDIVSGVNKLKSADNALERAGAGLQIGAGSAASAMALANTISMFSSAGSNLAATIGNVGTKVMQAYSWAPAWRPGARRRRRRAGARRPP
ncbi:hypothetical protein [Salinicola tamaricis]|uniref:hypothetical protein n=1 Tax=Salinicola tamaricis TaxID=1771309 RepID=UPI000D0A5790|nr:hypothetical protein [Salinicola tamaricis]